MPELKTAARELDRALTALSKTVDAYFVAAIAAGHATGEPTTHGLSARQLRQKLQQFVIARLSPKPTGGVNPLQFDGAPQARRYVEQHGLPGL